jgi:hypothetical protein
VGARAPVTATIDVGQHYREADRVLEWAREFGQFERPGNLAALEVVRLPNDHTTGTTPGRRIPWLGLPARTVNRAVTRALRRLTSPEPSLNRPTLG